MRSLAFPEFFGFIRQRPNASGRQTGQWIESEIQGHELHFPGTQQRLQKHGLFIVEDTGFATRRAFGEPTAGNTFKPGKEIGIAERPAGAFGCAQCGEVFVVLHGEQARET